MVLSILLFFVGCLLWLYIWLSGFKKSSLAHIPRTRGLPILGHLLDINLQRPELTFTSWTRKLGDVFTVQMLNKTFLVLNSYEAIHEASVTKGKHFGGRPRKQIFRFSLITNGFQDVAFRDPDAHWSLLRKTTHRQLKVHDGGSAYIEEVNLKVIHDLVGEFRSRAGSPFNPHDLVYNAVVNIMSTFLVGKKFRFDSEEFQILTEMEKVSAYIGNASEGVELDIFPWLRFFGNKTYKKVKEFVSIRDKLWEVMRKHALETLKENGDKASNKDGITQTALQLVNNNNNNNDVQLEENHIKLLIMDLLMAGILTTTSNFVALLNILCHYPEVQAKLQQEVDEVVGADRTVSLEDREQMPYTRAAILELLRYTSIAPLGIPHCVLQDVSVRGIPVPAGTEVLLNQWALHHDETFWEQPYEFRPERFLDADGQVLSPGTPERRHLMPFGAGTRVCVGELLALSRLFLMVSTCAQVFTVSTGDEKVSCDPRDYKGGIVLQQADFTVQVSSRNEHLFT